MERDKKIDPSKDLFVIYSDEINLVYARAVKEALRKHKQAGNPVPIERDGKMVWLQPDEIEIEEA